MIQPKTRRAETAPKDRIGGITSLVMRIQAMPAPFRNVLEIVNWQRVCVPRPHTGPSISGIQVPPDPQFDDDTPEAPPRPADSETGLPGSTCVVARVGPHVDDMNCL